nr:hypothetical protein [Candidatus Sigynarchaeota archaeon]
MPTIVLLITEKEIRIDFRRKEIQIDVFFCRIRVHGTHFRFDDIDSIWIRYEEDLDYSSRNIEGEILHFYLKIRKSVKNKVVYQWKVIFHYQTHKDVDIDFVSMEKLGQALINPMSFSERLALLESVMAIESHEKRSMESILKLGMEPPGWKNQPSHEKEIDLLQKIYTRQKKVKMVKNCVLLILIACMFLIWVIAELMGRFIFGSSPCIAGT